MIVDSATTAVVANFVVMSAPQITLRPLPGSNACFAAPYCPRCTESSSRRQSLRRLEHRINELISRLPQFGPEVMVVVGMLNP